MANELFKDLTHTSNTNVTWAGSRTLTYRHVLQSAHHQAVIDVPYHPLGQARVLFLFLSNVGERLGEREATDGGGMDQHRPPWELRLLQNLQNLQPVVEPPLGPQKVHYIAPDHKDVHAAVQVKVPVLGHGPWLGAEPGEEKKKGTGSGGTIRRV